MRLAPAFAPPAGWTPDAVRNVPSVHGSSALKSIVGTWRGTPEVQDGQALSGAQQTLLAPFLASAFGMGLGAVEDALRGVRIYVGGPPAQFGMGATVLSNRIYVRDQAILDRILSWDGRRLLAHEVGHVVQRLQSASALVTALGGGELGRDRAFLARYLAAGPGAVGAGLFAWIGHRIGRVPGVSIGDLIHDAHRMEAHVERIAIAFRDATR